MLEAEISVPINELAKIGTLISASIHPQWHVSFGINYSPHFP